MTDLPLPLRVGGIHDHDVLGAEGQLVAEVWGNNAQRDTWVAALVRAANLGPALARCVEALEGVLGHTDYCQGHRDCAEPVAPLWGEARAALTALRAAEIKEGRRRG